MNAVSRREKPNWMHDCKFIDELKEGEIGYTISWGFVSPEGEWLIARDELCSPYKRGTHNIMILREGETIYVRDGEMNGDYNSHAWDYVQIEGNSFPAFYKPLTLEEKVSILWAER